MHYEKRIKEATDWLHERGIRPELQRDIRKLYNIGKSEGPGFISYAHAKEATEWLHGRGIQTRIKEGVRKLYNIGKSEGPGFISYEQAKDLRSNFPKNTKGLNSPEIRRLKSYYIIKSNISLKL